MRVKTIDFDSAPPYNRGVFNQRKMTVQYSYLQVRDFLLSKGVPMNQTIDLTSELLQMIKAKGWWAEFSSNY